MISPLALLYFLAPPDNNGKQVGMKQLVSGPRPCLSVGAEGGEGLNAWQVARQVVLLRVPGKKAWRGRLGEKNREMQPWRLRCTSDVDGSSLVGRIQRVKISVSQFGCLEGRGVFSTQWVCFVMFPKVVSKTPKKSGRLSLLDPCAVLFRVSSLLVQSFVRKLLARKWCQC